MTRISKPPQERRQEIVLAARHSFCKKGFEQTTMAELAQQVNVAQGLIYHYFKSKTEILYAVIEQLAKEFAADLEARAIALDGCGNARIALKALIIENFSKMQVFIDYIQLEQSLKSEPSLIEYARSKLVLSVTPTIEAFIAKGRDDHSIACDYPKEYAVFLLSGLSGLSFYLFENQVLIIEALIDKLLEPKLAKGANI